MRRLTLAVTFFCASLAVAAAPPVSKELLEKGKASFNINCIACHGPRGAGDGAAAVALTPKPRNFATDTFKNGDKPEDLFKTLEVGLKDTAMVSFKHLPEEDRWALAYYVLELRNAGKPAVVDAGVPDAGMPTKGKKGKK